MDEAEVNVHIRARMLRPLVMAHANDEVVWCCLGYGMSAVSRIQPYNSRDPEFCYPRFLPR